MTSSNRYVNFYLMEIKYSTHAVERMIQRKISPKDVEEIIANPLGKIKQSNDKSIFYKKLKNRTDNLIAAVTVKRSIHQLEVITVMINFEVQK